MMADDEVKSEATVDASHVDEVKVKVEIPEEVTEFMQEQKALANRMIAHLSDYEDQKLMVQERMADFDREKQEVDEQLVELAQWKDQEESKLRKVIKGLMLFVTLWALGGVISGWYIWNTVETNKNNIARINALAANNDKLIKQVDTLNRTQANQAYQECIQRNAQTKASRKELAKLVSAHKRDGAMNASKFWKSYLDKINARKLPPCEKPKAVATGNGDPTETTAVPTTTVPRS